MQGASGQRVVVSGINRSLLFKGAVTLAVILVVGSLLLFATPSHYYFRAERGGLGLCKGRLWGLVGSAVPGYGFIPVSADAARSLVGKPFASHEEALNTLRPIVEQAAREGVAVVASREKELARLYQTVLPNLQGAKLLGIQGYDARVEALEKWMAVVTGQPHTPSGY
ncbi:MAG: hypothetical protein ACUVWY_15040 [Desulfosoma sp.]|uniref:hypothetical protein n=1 Tax=Desulfosoma sp. TaxID=2603217 RepID=UPI004049DA14